MCANLCTHLIIRWRKRNEQLVENLGDAIENGTRDQHSDALTVDGQKRKVEESEHLLNQRRDLLMNYRNAMDDLIKTDL
uniref:Uncharacterized protein n=1 Tax=Daucus carota subsp. sativus TaxID=79200 RepID=A0A166ENJ8_DAUCS